MGETVGKSLIGEVDGDELDGFALGSLLEIIDGVLLDGVVKGNEMHGFALGRWPGD